MFIAPPILRKNQIKLNYSNQYDLHEHTYAGMPTRQSGICKDVDEPKTDYHKWLENYKTEYTRDEIIKSYKAGIRDLSKSTNTDQKESKKNIRKVAVKSTSQPTQPVASNIVIVEPEEFSDVESNEDKSNDTEDIKDESYEDSETDEDIKDETYDTKVQTTTLDQKKVEEVFTLLSGLMWRDKDEQVMQYKVMNRLSDRFSQLLPIAMTLADDLFNAIHTTTGALDDIAEEEKYNFLFHIMAKGEHLYYPSIADPEFCLYLLDQYQPLYSFIKKKFKIRD